MANTQLKALTRKVDDLILLCDQLNNENRTLKAKASNWEVEREHLVEKSELARVKVKSMIDRLKAMEEQS